MVWPYPCNWLANPKEYLHYFLRKTLVANFFVKQIILKDRTGGRKWKELSSRVAKEHDFTRLPW